MIDLHPANAGLDRNLVGTYVPALPRGFQPQVKATRFAGGRLLKFETSDDD